ncbi:hypothetical protein LX36DRAFT_347744 [Colletotrichum falcatum]|nr:hypothetical protein LX36DRAFT_347744 [Colletotrichum falcatum]
MKQILPLKLAWSVSTRGAVAGRGRWAYYVVDAAGFLPKLNTGSFHPVSKTCMPLLCNTSYLRVR